MPVRFHRTTSAADLQSMTEPASGAALHETWAAFTERLFELFDWYSFLKFSSKAELIMTSTDPVLWTIAPKTGPNKPAIAKAMAAKFSAMEKVKFNLIVLMVFRESLIR